MIVPHRNANYKTLLHRFFTVCCLLHANVFANFHIVTGTCERFLVDRHAHRHRKWRDLAPIHFVQYNAKRFRSEKFCYCLSLVHTSHTCWRRQARRENVKSAIIDMVVGAGRDACHGVSTSVSLFLSARCIFRQRRDCFISSKQSGTNGLVAT